MENKKAAKELIKRAKKHPELYNAPDVWYAKMIRKREKQNERKINNSDARSRKADGLRGKSEQSEQSGQPKRKWFAWLLYKASTLVGF